jgi:hypothetical protein
MRTEQMRHADGFPSSRQVSSFESVLDRVRREAEENWTPGQALGEILSYLDRIDYFTATDLTASWVQSRMRWLTSVLRVAVERAQAIGLDPGLMNGVFSALYEHDWILGAERTVVGQSAKVARDLIRFEVAYLGLSKQQR